MRYVIAISIACLILSCNEITERMPVYEVHGIDVSHYQAQVKWDIVAAQKIDFAFVKATEGVTHTDSLFCSNWKSIRDAGLKRGAYHFFRPGRSAFEQARNFIDNVKLEAGDLPPVLDVEVSDEVAHDKVIERIQSWLEIIEFHYQIRPIIYTNLKFYNRYIASNFDDYPVWIARYNTKTPYLGKNKDWLFWQYGDRGQLKGINGFVDFNVFRGSLSELEALCLPQEAVYSFN